MNELGNIRPSQLIFTFGIGALLDLPNMSVIVMGLDDWETKYCAEVTENRLIGALRKKVGTSLKKLYIPPLEPEEIVGRSAEFAVGVPVTPFPRWLRCPVCDTLATIESGVFKFNQDKWKSDKTYYYHAGCTKARNPRAISVRFLLACREGHLTDFPWIEYVHNGKVACKPSRLTLREYGASGDASDIVVKCLECNSEKRMGEAFDREKTNFRCRAHHPHLRTIAQEGCVEQARTILLGASNSWFPLILSALSIPESEDRLAQLIDAHWKDLIDIDSLQTAKYAVDPKRMPDFSEFKVEDIWKAIEKKKKDPDKKEDDTEDLRYPEWLMFSNPSKSIEAPDFKLTEVEAPKDFEDSFEKTVLVERLREVRALFGFTRIESNGDFTDAAIVDEERITRLCRKNPQWLPVSEVRGEGIFIRFKEEKLVEWENLKEVKMLEKLFLDSHSAWRRKRKLEPVEANFHGIRYVLMHSFAHALMRQIALDCGYTAASIRERIYCKRPHELNGPMSGILIYTAASDSEGTLGGLVDIGNPLTLGRNIQQALESMKICGSDPLCSEKKPTKEGRNIHGACCHACLFSPETSCERGNRYLDRSTLVKTFTEDKTAFFSNF